MMNACGACDCLFACSGFLIGKFNALVAAERMQGVQKLAGIPHRRKRTVSSTVLLLYGEHMHSPIPHCTCIHYLTSPRSQTRCRSILNQACVPPRDPS